MIIIESVRLRNFRAIKEAFFQPITSGITGLFGSNGAGKSTVLAGILYALYSIRPAGATTGSLRRRGSRIDEECSASIVFQHLGQQVEVIREIRGKNNTTLLNIYVDGVEASVTSVSAGDAWIRQRLGVDANGFLTAFVTRQKELDQIIAATPAVRKQIFEKLAGIETINEALKAARKNENDTKGTLDNLRGSEREVTDAFALVENLTNKQEELRFATERLKNQLDQSVVAEQEAETAVQSLREMETTLIRKQGQLANILDADKHANEALYRLKYLDDVQEDFDLEDLREQHRSITAKLTELRQEQSTKQVSRQTLLLKNQELLAEQTALQERIEPLQKEYQQLDSKKLIEQLVEVQNQQTEITKELNQAKAREQDLANSITTLGHAAECPTCHTHLDDPEKLIATLTASREAFTTQITQAQVRLSELTSKEAELDANASGKRELDQLIFELAENQKAREQVLADLPAEEDITALEKQIELADEERDKITEIGKRASSIVADRAERDELRNKLATNASLANDLQIEITELQRGFSQQKLDKAVALLNKIRQDKQVLQTDWNNSNREYGETNTRLTFANKEHKDASERWKRKKELLQAVEQNALTTELIDKFRRETVASLTPELTDRASELINDITSGAYTEIRIDDDFNITVINSEGDERKVGELSGGEESAVALSLRLAIGLLITGGQPSLLFMDEPFVSQDSERRMSMLETIQQLPYQQIILVSHDGTAEQVADLSVLVKPNLKEGSTLEVLSGGLEADIIAELEQDLGETSDPIEFEEE